MQKQYLVFKYFKWNFFRNVKITEQKRVFKYFKWNYFRKVKITEQFFFYNCEFWNLFLLHFKNPILNNKLGGEIWSSKTTKQKLKDHSDGLFDHSKESLWGYHLGVKTPKRRMRKHLVLVSPAMSHQTLGNLKRLQGWLERICDLHCILLNALNNMWHPCR